jgi:hypothetical protein
VTVTEILGVVASFLALTMITILVDRYLGDKTAMAVLVACLAVLCWVNWTWLTTQLRQAQEHRITFIVVCTLAFAVIGTLTGVIVTQHAPGVSNSQSVQPACYLFPNSQVIDGQLVLMIANQTKIPVDDLDVDITVLYSDNATTEPSAVEWADHLKWGTCKALLTTQFSVPNKEFRVSGHTRYAIWFSMTTRAEGTFRETIDVIRETGTQFRAETRFYKGTDAKPSYSESITLITLDFPSVGSPKKSQSDEPAKLRDHTIALASEFSALLRRHGYPQDTWEDSDDSFEPTPTDERLRSEVAEKLKQEMQRLAHEYSRLGMLNENVTDTNFPKTLGEILELDACSDYDVRFIIKGLEGASDKLEKGFIPPAQHRQRGPAKLVPHVGYVVTAQDPRLYLEIKDERGATFPRTVFAVTNQGGSVGHKIKIGPLEWPEGSATFKEIDSIPVGGTVEIDPKVENADIYKPKDISQILRNRKRTPLEFEQIQEFPLTVAYQDYAAHAFEGSIRIMYAPLRDMLRRSRMESGKHIVPDDPTIWVLHDGFKRLS